MIITGIQPTGTIHLGNYLGALVPAIALQQSGAETFVFIADQHAITAAFDPQALRSDIRRLVAMIVAAGFDTVDGCIFRQSSIGEHVELAHILGCTAARVGPLSRMIQYREKMDNLAENGETPSLGLFSYPVLQAADILLYQDEDGTPTRVPVGDDQSQHLNLTTDLARAFNHRFGDTFVVPQQVVSTAPRIMSLTDPTKKMSKSDPNDNSRINLTDTPDVVARKIKRATSDTALIDGDLANRPALANLLAIMAAMRNTDAVLLAEEFTGRGFGHLKAALTDVVVAKVEPIRIAFEETAPHAEAYLNNIRPAAIAQRTMARVRQAVGLD